MQLYWSLCIQELLITILNLEDRLRHDCDWRCCKISQNFSFFISDSYCCEWLADVLAFCIRIELLFISWCKLYLYFHPILIDKYQYSLILAYLLVDIATISCVLLAVQYGTLIFYCFCIISMIQVSPELFVDTARDQKTRINMAVYFPKLPCVCKLFVNGVSFQI